MSVKKVVWQVALRSSGVQLDDGSEPSVLLWVDVTTECVRHVATLPPELAVDGFGWESQFKNAVESQLPGCTFLLPTEIQVEDREVLACLKELVSPLGVKVSLKKRLTFLDRVHDSLTDFLQEDSSFNYLADGQLQSEEIAGLAEDMLLFMNARPFEVLNGDDILEVKGLSPSPVFCSVLGMGKMEYGLGIYLTRESADAYLEEVNEEMMARQPALSLTLVSQEDCPPMLAFEVGEHQWPCHPLGFPLLMRVDGDRLQPTSAEIRLARDLLRLVVLYVAKRKSGAYSLDGRQLKIRPLHRAEPMPDLKSLIFSQLLLDMPGAEQVRPKSKGARR